MNKYSNEIKKFILQRISKKHSTSQVAKEFELPLKTVEKWITAYNKDPNCFNDKIKINKKETDEIIKKYKEIKKDNEILKAMISSLSKKTK